MKKRLLAIGLCASMFPGMLMGCSQKDADPVDQEVSASDDVVADAADVSSDEVVKITLASFPDQPKDALMAAFDSAGLEGIELEIIEYPQNEYENKIKMAFGSGTATDLILMDGPNIASYAASGVLEPLDSYWDDADFDDLVGSAQSAMVWEGQTWAAPLNESNTVMFYDKNVFDELGIKAPTTLEDAWTFEEFLDVCEQVTIPGERYAVQPQMFTMDNKNEGMAFTQMLWLWAAGGEVLNEDATKADGYFNSEESKAGIQYYADLFAKGYASTEAIANPFETGKVVMWLNGPWMIGTWANEFPDVEWGAMPMPEGVRGASGAGSWNIAISESCEHKEEAWKVIEAITGEKGSQIWCEMTGNLPARKSVLESDAAYSEYPFDIISDQLVETAMARPVTAAYPQISEALQDCFNAVAFGEDVDTAVEKATQKMEEALQAIQ